MNYIISSNTSWSQDTCNHFLSYSFPLWLWLGAQENTFLGLPVTFLLLHGTTAPRPLILAQIQVPLNQRGKIQLVQVTMNQASYSQWSLHKRTHLTK